MHVPQVATTSTAQRHQSSCVWPLLKIVLVHLISDLRDLRVIVSVGSRHFCPTFHYLAKGFRLREDAGADLGLLPMLLAYLRFVASHVTVPMNTALSSASREVSDRLI